MRGLTVWHLCVYAYKIMLMYPLNTAVKLYFFSYTLYRILAILFTNNNNMLCSSIFIRSTIKHSWKVEACVVIGLLAG